ncbi:transporter substrate-binding domain-containing protein [Paraglaciecola aquimarina]|uniref:Transporter substrate-binding domain-containing protein n=1 Tax=Paraglaciecola algarum TaxID=3050085 RepID=A0ABS9D538_9ALTE|nr:transporter substrate-binding domain-containing protein [Paraglaciecola sp. G1-23]MCF2947535.1 transporter substrate-binding domain-containing protein [Paraglaciecola sp. G1-23]
MKLCRLLLIILINLSLAGCQPAATTEEKSNSITQSETNLLPEANTSSTNCNLTLGFDAWEPYQYVDVGGKVTGLDIELISLVTEKIGCKITYQQGTWVELLNSLKTGEVDMLLGASKTKAREQYALFSSTYRTEQFSLYIRHADKKRQAFDSIDKFITSNSRIGIVEDYYYGPQIAMLLEGSVTSKLFVNAIMGELNVARLLDNDIDVYIEDSFVGASMLRRKALSNRITPHKIAIETGDVYVMFAKDTFSNNQLEDFNQQLSTIKNSPLFENLMNKYSQ